MAGLIKALASWGLWPPDLNATNFLSEPNGQILVLDWDKARWLPKPCPVKKYWARLERSMKKLNAPKSLIDALHNELLGERK